MVSILKQTAAKILDTPALATWSGNRVYDRPLKRTGTGATPEAFDADGRPLPSFVITEDGTAEDIGNPDGTIGFLYVWLYGRDTEAMREQIRATGDLVIAAVPGVYDGPGGTAAELEFPGGRLGVREDPGLDSAAMDQIRFDVSILWR